MTVSKKELETLKTENRMLRAKLTSNGIDAHISLQDQIDSVKRLAVIKIDEADEAFFDSCCDYLARINEELCKCKKDTGHLLQVRTRQRKVWTFLADMLAERDFQLADAIDLQEHGYLDKPAHNLSDLKAESIEQFRGLSQRDAVYRLVKYMQRVGTWKNADELVGWLTKAAREIA
jgi:hypothetical protein